MKENESLGVHLLCGSRQSDRTYLKKEVVNPTGDFKRVGQKMAQIEEFVHVERISMLMEMILSRENLIAAFKRVDQNKGSHGVDGE